MEKNKDLIEVEKILKIEINDFSIENKIIECVTFENSIISNTKVLESIKFLYNLKRLFVLNCKIDSIDFIDELKELEELTIVNSNLENKSGWIVSKPPNLLN